MYKCAARLPGTDDAWHVHAASDLLALQQNNERDPGMPSPLQESKYCIDSLFSTRIINLIMHTQTADVLARYKAMHETLVYLAHLDHDDTESQMLDRLRDQVGWVGWGFYPAGFRRCVLREPELPTPVPPRLTSPHPALSRRCARGRSPTAGRGAGGRSTGCAGPSAPSRAAWWRSRRTGDTFFC